MAMSIAPMTIDYYLREAISGDAPNQRDATAYYTSSKNPPGTWFGNGLHSLGLTEGQSVEAKTATTVYKDFQHPETGEQLARPPKGSNRRAGYDLTFSPPKSVSTVWALSGPQVRGEIRKAHHEAVQETLTYIEENLLQTRAGHKGLAREDTGGMVASLFDHWDTRDGDPHLHTHAVIMNLVARSSDGQMRAVHAHPLYQHAVAMSERYTNRLMDKLHTRLGAQPELRGPLNGISPEVTALGNTVDDHGQALDELPPTKGQRIELAGVPDEVIQEFSQRARAIEEALPQQISAFKERTGRDPRPGELDEVRRSAWAVTRTPKSNQPTPLADKQLTWRRRAQKHADPDALVHEALGRPQQTIHAEDLTEAQVQALGAAAIQEASRGRTTFRDHNLLTASERVSRLIRCTSFEEREALSQRIIEAAKANQELEELDRGAARMNFTYNTRDQTKVFDASTAFERPAVYTTATNLAQENYLITRVTQAAGPTIPDGEDLEQALGEYRTSGGHALSEDQHAATREVLTDGKGISGLIGPAGTGKTSTTRAIADQWKAHHGEASVVGLAPSEAAARVLGADLEAETDNTAKWLYESTGPGAQRRYQQAQKIHDHLSTLYAAEHLNPAQEAKADQLEAQLGQLYATQARYTLKPNQLLIIDEASMASNEQLAALAQQAETAGAKVLLVGDPSQLDAVDAGGFLGYLERHHQPARLNRVFRFRNQWEAQASLQLREGNAAALQAYTDHDRLHQAEDPTTEAYTAWKNDLDEGADSILIASNNTEVAELNQQARTDRAAAGDVDLAGPTTTLRNRTTAGRGDVILARQNNRNLRDSHGAFITNGTRMSINTITPDGSAEATVTTTGATVTLDAAYLKNSVELGYATTTHRAQGITVDTAHAVVAPEQSRELLYVAMTRGKHANHVYMNPDDPEAHAPDPTTTLAPEQGPATIDEALKNVLARTRAEETATETRDRAHGWAKDLGRLQHEKQHLQNHPPAEDPESTATYSAALEQLEELIDQATRTKVNQVIQDRPDWAQDTLRSHPPAQAEEILTAAVKWRAASDQNDAETLLGRTPSSDDYLHPHYEAAKTRIKAAQQPNPATPEEPADEEMRESIRQLLEQEASLLGDDITTEELPQPDGTEESTEYELAQWQQQTQPHIPAGPGTPGLN